MEDFVDVSKERNSNVWNFFLWNRRDEKAKYKSCDAVFKCKRSSTKSLFEHFKRIHSKEIGKVKEGGTLTRLNNLIHLQQPKPTTTT